MQTFTQYSWPGNIRQLRNVINRMVIMTRGERLTLRDVPSELQETKIVAAGFKETASHHLNLAETEQRLIRQALAETQGNISRAAILLGISRRTLHRKLKDLR